LNPGNGLGSGRHAPLYHQISSKLEWNEYREWLLANKQRSYALKLFRYSKRYWELAFTKELVLMKSNRERVEALKAIANLTRYLDIQNDTSLHEEFTTWMKRKELHWNVKNSIDTYKLAQQLNVKKVVMSLSKLPTRYKIFGLFVLVSGLRTSEAIKAYRNHDKLCNNGIMEMFWDRKTKKANVVFCHPLLHSKITKSIITSTRKI